MMKKILLNVILVILVISVIVNIMVVVGLLDFNGRSYGVFVLITLLLAFIYFNAHNKKIQK